MRSTDRLPSPLKSRMNERQKQRATSVADDSCLKYLIQMYLELSEQPWEPRLADIFDWIHSAATDAGSCSRLSIVGGIDMSSTLCICIVDAKKILISASTGIAHAVKELSSIPDPMSAIITSYNVHVPYIYKHALKLFP